MRKAWTLALMLALPAMATEPAQPALDEASAQFASRGMAPTLALCRLPVTCNGLAPTRATRSRFQTGNDNDVDQRHLSFPGLHIEVVYILANASMPPGQQRVEHPYRKPYIQSLTLTSDQWPGWRGLKVGSRREAVEAALGAGLKLTHDCASYSDPTTQAVATVCYAAGRVRSIEWTPWWDG